MSMNQDHSFEASFGEDADLLHLLEELKLNELNLDIDTGNAMPVRQQPQRMLTNKNKNVS